MYILVTNDDGVNAPGKRTLKQCVINFPLRPNPPAPFPKQRHRKCREGEQKGQKDR